jgi:hypothetical protein
MDDEGKWVNENKGMGRGRVHMHDHEICMTYT